METATARQQATGELIARLWQRSLPVVQERLSVLDSAARTAVLPPDLRARAIVDAHKLAGSLGMFGYPQGSDLAREIEHLLEATDPPPPHRLAELTTALRATLFPTT